MRAWTVSDSSVVRRVWREVSRWVMGRWKEWERRSGCSDIFGVGVEVRWGAEMEGAARDRE